MLRRAHFAGAWYPAGERACREAIEAHAADTEPRQAPWRGIIAPHAGWYYSGDAAGHAYRWLQQAQPDADLVVVFGSHRGPSGPNTVFCDRGWCTPLGPLQTAQPLADKVRERLNLQPEPAEPARPDNGVEIHLPFVKYFFPHAELLMLGVEAGPRAEDIGLIVGEMCTDAKRRAVFVASTDLTHYGPNYGFETQGAGQIAQSWVRGINDRGFIDRVLAGDARGALEHGVSEGSACCPGAVVAALHAASTLGDAGERALIDHYLSSDIQPASSFVGYCGVAF